MDKCSWYHMEPLSIPNPELRQDRQSAPPTEITKEWCSHKHSPCLKGICGGSGLLKCGGDFDACTIEDHLVGDFE